MPEAPQLQLFEQQLDLLFSNDELFKDCPARLLDAMRYSIFNGGKRVRPLLVYTIGEALNLEISKLHPLALAVELIHCYSLVHDDLPAMDNDDWRRGKPSCHKQFDEATAILVGDGLNSLAFAVLNHPKFNPNSADNCSKLSLILAQATGPAGMVGGQSIDLQSENNPNLPLEQLELLHRQKTGKLLQACCLLPLALVNIKDNLLVENITNFGATVGLAFQVQDDLLEFDGNLEQLGKDPNSDKNAQKSTFPKILGVEAAQKYLADLWLQAEKQLDYLLMYDTKFDELKSWLNKLIKRVY